MIISIHLFALFLYSLRQKVLLDSINVRLSLRKNIAFQFTGYSMLITPGGIGELIKTHFIKKNHATEYVETIPVVLAEKYHNLLALISIITIMLFFRFNFEIQVITIIIWLLLITTLIIVKNQKIFPIYKIPRIWILKSILDNTTKFSDTISTLLEKKIFVKCLILGIGATLVDAVAIYVCFMAFDIHYDFVSSTLFTGSSLVVGAISFLPNGIGITDLSMVGLFAKSGIPILSASALTVFIRLMISWSTIIIGIITLKFIVKKKKN